MATSAGSVTGTRGAFLIAHTHLAADRPAGLVICDRLYSTTSYTREPGPVKGGATVIAFVTDPDGYKIELIQRQSIS